MKINWGTGIVLAFIGFISFIMFFVVRMNVQDKYDHDLVTESYYEAELVYQGDIDKLKNAQKLPENITWERISSGIVLKFPKALTQEKIKGKVFLYRPSGKQHDFEMHISLSDHTLLIPDNRLLDGRWDIKVDWTYEDQAYLYKEVLVY
ncbi:FixH family protein [Kordia jejudonensis]|uniref:FixH family protein n=1 Tax=Kordia jejudonensis TaxID=1348245 RepID=UPI0006293191|nr:FixH family protein [Kordia jejudonensis]